MTKIIKELKFKVVLEALKGDATRIELVNKYKISKSAINRWKAEFLEKGAKIFEIKAENAEKEMDNYYYRKIKSRK